MGGGIGENHEQQVDLARGLAQGSHGQQLGMGVVRLIPKLRVGVNNPA